jgi:5-methyltetrahydropteroyltriglutamate--homocysteine methyltransferase
MKTSSERILTTHVGSLPRPEKLREMLFARYTGEDVTEAADEALTKEIADSIEQVVKDQVEAGIDVVSDGEMGKVSYAQYMKHRVTGFGEEPAGYEPPGEIRLPIDFYNYPDWIEWCDAEQMPIFAAQPFCVGDLSYTEAGKVELQKDLKTFRSAVDGAKAVDGFLNAASPGIISEFAPNAHYPSVEKYVEALGEAMAPEYEAIIEAGFNLQLDCPDLAASRMITFYDLSDAEFHKLVDHRVEVINHATRNIPPERMRMHLCWGNYSGPHDHDHPVAKLIPHIAKARPQALLFEGANPAHEHEWADWRDADIPDDKILVPGVVDSTSNFVEHPRLVAQRITRFANIVGRERVIAGSDCGFSTFSTKSQVAPSVVWAKFRAMAEGAAIASKELWGKSA